MNELEKSVLEFFDSIDTNNDGKLQPAELQALEDINNNAVFSRILKITKRTTDGDVDFDAFKQNVLAFMGETVEDKRLCVFFDFYDADSDGVISRDDLVQVLSHTMELGADDSDVLTAKVDQIFAAFDTDNNNKIERTEFMKAAKKGGALELLV